MSTLYITLFLAFDLHLQSIFSSYFILKIFRPIADFQNNSMNTPNILVSTVNIQSYFSFFNLFFNWRKIALQCCWFSHIFLLSLSLFIFLQMVASIHQKSFFHCLPPCFFLITIDLEDCLISVHKVPNVPFLIL